MYVGQTVDEERRQAEWMNLGTPYTSKGSKIDNARKKYGPENFSYQVIYVGVFSTYKEAIGVLDQVETYYIDLYDTVENGYNICSGGKSPSTRRDSKVTVVYTIDGVLVGKYSSLTEASISLGRDERKMRANAQRRTHNVQNDLLVYFEEDFSEELLENDMSYYKNFSSNRPIVQLTLDGEFIQRYNNVKEAYDNFDKSKITTKFNTKLILSCCSLAQRISSLAGYKWAFEDDYIKGGRESYRYFNRKERQRKQILQIDTNTFKIVNIFDGLADAANAVKGSTSQFPPNAIISSCSKRYSTDVKVFSTQVGKSKKLRTARGFIWMYKSDYNIVRSSDENIKSFIKRRYSCNEF